MLDHIRFKLHRRRNIAEASVRCGKNQKRLAQSQSGAVQRECFRRGDHICQHAVAGDVFQSVQTVQIVPRDLRQTVLVQNIHSGIARPIAVKGDSSGGGSAVRNGRGGGEFFRDRPTELHFALTAASFFAKAQRLFDTQLDRLRVSIGGRGRFAAFKPGQYRAGHGSRGDICAGFVLIIYVPFRAGAAASIEHAQQKCVFMNAVAEAVLAVFGNFLFVYAEQAVHTVMYCRHVFTSLIPT